MESITWTPVEQAAAYATYIGRTGCRKNMGVEVHTSHANKRITLSPLNVDNCQIDIPSQHLGKLIAMLRKAQKEIKAKQKEELHAAQP